jgi:hypothetical protein
MLANDLIAANQQNKQRLAEVLKSAEPRRGSDVIPSLRAAFLQKPELIYLLTDGDFLRDGVSINADVLREILWLNREKRIKINTIGFPGNAQETEYLRTLKQIAEGCGGTFRSIQSDEVGREVR